MKVAYYLGGLNRGGAESLILDICRRNDSVPFDFSCVFRKDGNLTEEFQKTDAELVKLPKKGNIIKYIMQLRKCFKDGKVDIVHAQTPSSAMLCVFALLLTKIKLVVTFHGHYVSVNNHYLKWVYRHCDRVVCVSKFQKTYFEKRLRLPQINRLQVVYNGIDFTKVKNAQNVTKDGVLENNHVKLCMVGSFGKGRSQEVIVRSMKCLKDSGKCGELDFYFIGGTISGEEYIFEKCKALVEENNLHDCIHFLGLRTDVYDLLKQMDGYVYSTVSDTFGISVIEAMASGLPVVVNDWDVMKEVCGDWATYFRSNDIEDCANTMVDLVQNMDNYKMKTKQIAPAVMEKYSIEKHINDIDFLYKSLK